MALRRPRYWLDQASVQGRFITGEIAAQAQAFTAEGRFTEALDVLEAGAEPVQETLFWLNMMDAARYLGDAERATAFYRRYLEGVEGGELRSLIESVISSDCSVVEGMQRVVTAYSGGEPQPAAWEDLAQLPMEEDVSRLRAWLRRLLSEDPPPDEVGALRFGMVNVGDAEQLSVAMYLSGVVDDADDPEWALGPASWEPSGAYAPSEVLGRIYSIASTRDTAPDGNFLCFLYCTLAVRALATSLEPEVLCGRRAERTLAVGWDDGDGVILGKVTSNGFTFRPREVTDVEVRAIKKPVSDLFADLVGPDDGKSHKARLVLGSTYPADRDAVPGLVAGLGHAHPGVRFWATIALGGIGRDAESAVPGLIPLLQDPQPATRQTAARTLASIGAPAAGEALPALKEMLRTEAPSVRVSVVEALGDLAEDIPDAIEPLAGSLRDPDSTVRGQAATALELLGSRAQQALPALREVAADEHEDAAVRMQAQAAIAVMTGGSRS